MAPPANIRATVGLPTPSLVTSTGPMGVVKQNGIWTVSFNVDPLAPGVVDTSPNKYLVMWDGGPKTFTKIPLSGLLGVGAAQIRVTSSPYNVQTSDRILNCNVAGALTVNLPLSAIRNGAPLQVEDVSGNAATNHITVVPSGAETVNGLANAVILVNYGSLLLVPFYDGIGTGWFTS